MSEIDLHLERLECILNPLIEAIQSSNGALERIATALELLAKPVKEDIERRAEMAEREEQDRDYYESQRMGGP